MLWAKGLYVDCVLLASEAWGESSVVDEGLYVDSVLLVSEQ